MTDTLRRRARPLLIVGWVVLVVAAAINITEALPVLVAWGLYLATVVLGVVAAVRGSVWGGVMLVVGALAVWLGSFSLLWAAASV